MDCPFCSFYEDRNRVLAQKAHVVVLLSNPRLMEGHTLVIPRRHVSALSELQPAARNELFGTAIEFQEKIKRVFSERLGRTVGCDLSQHDRLFMPTTAISVPGHVHIHLRPRFWQDPYYEDVLKHETAMFHSLTDVEKCAVHLLLAEKDR